MMRRIILFFLIGFLVMACSPEKGDSVIKCMSFNIRYDNPRDSANSWTNRKELALKTILGEDADIIGMQEVLLSQQKYLESNLPDYDFYAVGRDDGKNKGEMGSVFFKKDKFEVLDKSTFWLSESPETVGSKGWNAVLPRIVSWIKFRNLEDSEVFYFFNTHFSHVGDEARSNSASLLVDRIVNIAGSHPVIVSGDFNCTKESEPYKILTTTLSNGKPVLFDTHYISKTEHYGGLKSMNGFGRSKREAIIDYIFCNEGFEVQEHGILPVIENGLFVSDHFPVVSVLSFKD